MAQPGSMNGGPTEGASTRAKKFMESEPFVADAVAARFSKFVDPVDDGLDSEDVEDLQAGGGTGEEDIPSRARRSKKSTSRSIRAARSRCTSAVRKIPG